MPKLGNRDERQHGGGGGNDPRKRRLEATEDRGKDKTKHPVR